MGLAQNFAAIRALAVEGIQKGHMALHSRNVAAAAGVPNHLIPQVAAQMVKSNQINKQSALDILKQINENASTISTSSSTSGSTVSSTAKL